MRSNDGIAFQIITVNGIIRDVLLLIGNAIADMIYFPLGCRIDRKPAYGSQNRHVQNQIKHQEDKNFFFHESIITKLFNTKIPEEVKWLRSSDQIILSWE